MPGHHARPRNVHEQQHDGLCANAEHGPLPVRQHKDGCKGIEGDREARGDRMIEAGLLKDSTARRKEIDDRENQHVRHARAEQIAGGEVGSLEAHGSNISRQLRQ